MIAANGEDIPTLGIGEFTFTFSGKQFHPQQLLQGSLPITGLDFMQKYSCDISMQDCTVTTDGMVIKCFMKGKKGCYRITAMETITILSEHEVVIPAKVDDQGILFENVGIIEHSEKLMESKNIMSCRGLTKTYENVPVRLMNPSHEPVVIRKGTEIGTFEPVREVKGNNVDQSTRKDNSALPQQLQILLERSSKHLNIPQKNAD